MLNVYVCDEGDLQCCKIHLKFAQVCKAFNSYFYSSWELGNLFFFLKKSTLTGLLRLQQFSTYMAKNVIFVFSESSSIWKS